MIAYDTNWYLVDSRSKARICVERYFPLRECCGSRSEIDSEMMVAIGNGSHLMSCCFN